MATRTLILGAGEGTRVGGPKALLMIEGEPLAKLHAQEGAVIVLRDRVADLLDLAPARVVRSHEDDALGPAGSIRAAVRAGAITDGPWLVTPVDVLPAKRAMIDRLLEALEGHDAARYRRGHPIAIRGEILRARFERDPVPTLRDVLSSIACARLEADALDDLDSPDDVLRVTGRAPLFFRGAG